MWKTMFSESWVGCTEGLIAGEGEKMKMPYISYRDHLSLLSQKHSALCYLKRAI